MHLVLPDWRSADVNTSYLGVMRTVGGFYFEKTRQPILWEMPAI